MPLSVSPLQLRPADVDAMAELLVARHTVERRQALELPAAYDLQVASGQVVMLLKRSNAGALGAWQADRLVGRLAAHWELPDPWSLTALFHRPRSVVAEHAIAPDASDSRDVARQLYAAVAGRWVARGGLAHYVFASAFDVGALDGWFSLGFGQDQALGVRDLRPVDGAARDVTLRAASDADSGIVARLAHALDQHHAAAPVFMPALFEHGVARANDLADALRPTLGAETEPQVWLARTARWWAYCAVIPRSTCLPT